MSKSTTPKSKEPAAPPDVRMLARERQQEILDLLQRDGSARVSVLAKLLNVTEETIRRDLERLGGEGRLVRTHGGALPVETDRRELPFGVRETVRLVEKRAIAVCAARFVAEGDVVALDASSTARELARVLPDIALTVVTNSMTVASELLDRDRIRVVSTGGILETSTLSYVGAIAEDALRRFNCRKAFLSCQGVDVRRGFTVTADEQAGVKRRMVELARQIYILADSSKFDAGGVEYFASLDDVDVLITDAAAPDETLAPLRDAGIRVEIAG